MRQGGCFTKKPRVIVAIYDFLIFDIWALLLNQDVISNTHMPLVSIFICIKSCILCSGPKTFTNRHFSENGAFKF